MNIAGFDFGCQIDVGLLDLIPKYPGADAAQGTCPLSSVTPPLSSLGGGDGAGQMQHFVDADQMNIFRLRMSPNSKNLGVFILTVESCLMAVPSQQPAWWHT